MDSSAFQDTTVEWSGRPGKPVRASRVTRAVYCLALAAFALSALAHGASWITAATDGALSTALATWVLFVISAAMAYRAYGVVSYADTLDARPPYLLGWLMRWTGWLAMAAGVAGLLTLLLAQSMAFLPLKGDQAIGIAGPSVLLWATLLASTGWLGCVLFEISRWTGYRVSPPVAAGSRGERIRHTVAL
ncbi:MAG TPA: hypothetical protein VKP68_02585 [Ramlibacter sp.]|nr:hypothetical protein [Ramlibacter sp.]